jgi:hypothetical protein
MFKAGDVAGDVLKGEPTGEFNFRDRGAAATIGISIAIAAG